MVCQLLRGDVPFNSDIAGSDVPAPLLSSVLSQATDLPAPLEKDVATPFGPRKSSTPSSTGSNSGQKKIPKWLKMGLSKLDFIMCLPCSQLIYL